MAVEVAAAEAAKLALSLPAALEAATAATTGAAADELAAVGLGPLPWPAAAAAERMASRMLVSQAP